MARHWGLDGDAILRGARAASEASDQRDPAHGRATAGDNKAVHLIRRTEKGKYLTMCGKRTPIQAQTTQDKLPNCKKCFGE